MSSISGSSSDLMSNIVSAFTQSNSTSNSTTASTDSPSSNTGTSSTPAKQTASIGLMLAEDRLSLSQSLLNALSSSSSSPDSSLEALLVASENLSVLRESNMINTHPDLVQSILSVVSSQSSDTSSLSTGLLNTLEQAGSSQNNTTLIGSLLDTLA